MIMFFVILYVLSSCLIQLSSPQTKSIPLIIYKTLILLFIFQKK